MNMESYIVFDSGVRSGKPCIKGTRITVGDILKWLASGMTSRQIVEDFPELKEEHIQAALAFAVARDANTETVFCEIVA